MKKVSLCLLIMLSGCGTIITEKYDATSGKMTEKTHIYVFAQKSIVRGISTFKTTKTGASSVSITGLDNETQTEVITASGEALGNLIGAAAKSAAK